MQTGSKKLVRFMQSWIINTVAVLMAVIVLRNHITYGEKWENLLAASLLLGILNAFVRPFLMFVALPLLIFTLGLFMFVINALLLSLLTLLLPFFHISMCLRATRASRSSAADRPIHPKIRAAATAR